MKVLVTGATGQLGYDVVLEGKAQGLDMIGVGSSDFDLTDEKQVARYIDAVQPDVIIHCAAYTKVDQAEVHPNVCKKVNVLGTKHIVQAAQKRDTTFLYVSTDYVFDGKKDQPYTEKDETNPINVYGQTKLAGEHIVQRLLDKWFIVRLSWLFGKNGRNFVTSMVELAKTRNTLNVVVDQVGSPTYTLDAANVIIQLIQTSSFGIYHVTNTGYCSWFAFAEEIFTQLRKQQVNVLPIPSEQFPSLAERPVNSRLDHRKLVDVGISPLRHWKEALHHYLKQINRTTHFEKDR